MLFESEVHHPAGDEHPEQTVDASPEIEEDGGQDQNDAVQQVVDKSDFHFILVLEVGDDDVRSAGRKTVVETKPMPAPMIAAPTSVLVKSLVTTVTCGINCRKKMFEATAMSEKRCS